jgi:hypothetical protein
LVAETGSFTRRRTGVHMANRPDRPPTFRKVQIRGLVIALDGKERPYDVYRFGGGVRKYEKPKHNPFKDL